MKGKTIFTPEQADQIVRSELQKNSRKKIQPVIDEGNKFLAENAKKPGVKKTASGLQYEVLVLGNGPKPSDTSVVKVHYSGFLLNGKPFDSSVERGEPATFPLGNVIRGWTEGVQLMPVGSKFKFYIPYQLGYGEQGSGEAIPGGSALIFEVELLEIVTNK
jgi:FKBP-type peptidyl-prolyl cis-trans isomerase